jgi:hypothetical protein
MTLDDFIRSRIDSKLWPRNAYVTESGFSALYVRVTQRYIEGQVWEPVLDLAKLEAKSPGKGAFTALVARLRKDWPRLGLFVECANPRFSAKLAAMGFRHVPPDSCYWVPPTESSAANSNALRG